MIGKVYRLGLSGRAKALPGNVPASPPHHKAPRRPAHRHADSPQIAGNTALAFHPFVIEAPAPQTVRDVVVPISEPVTIMELRESMCRWPIGDPAQSQFRFCGAKKLPGEGPYCACHGASPIKPNMTRSSRLKVCGSWLAPVDEACLRKMV